MSQEQANAFLERMKSDEPFRNAVKGDGRYRDENGLYQSAGIHLYCR
ncbi:MAG: Nif11 family protein [Chlorobiaceae bacterium]|nr:Nif11 family protein [Chlorobiaceae bacterium]